MFLQTCKYSLEGRKRNRLSLTIFFVRYHLSILLLLDQLFLIQLQGREKGRGKRVKNINREMRKNEEKQIWDRLRWNEVGRRDREEDVEKRNKVDNL